MPAGSIVPIIAAGSSAHRASIVQHLARRRALSPADAVPFLAGSTGKQRAFDALLRKRVILEAEPSRFYLEEDAVGAIRDRRLRVLRIVAVGAIVTGVLAISAALVR